MSCNDDAMNAPLNSRQLATLSKYEDVSLIKLAFYLSLVLK